MAVGNKITIVHGLPDTNAGGSALGIALIEVLQETYPEADLAYMSKHARPDLIAKAHPYLNARFADVPVIPYPIAARSDHYDVRPAALRRMLGLFWVVKTVFAAFILVFPSLSRRAGVKAIRESALVISRGTQIFYDKPGHWVMNVVSHFWLHFPMLLAARCGIPFVVYALAAEVCFQPGKARSAA
jgi:hypothetical protein